MAQARGDGVDAEGGTGAVQLCSRNRCAARVCRPGAIQVIDLRLHAGDTVEHGDRTVEHLQRPLHLDGGKPTCPGVSMMLICALPEQVVAAERS